MATSSTNDTAQTVEFGELPARTAPAPRNGWGKWAKVATQLRSRPGEWARIASRDRRTTAYSLASQIRRGAYSAMPKGEFEATNRPGTAGTFDVWARYVGEQS